MRTLNHSTPLSAAPRAPRRLLLAAALVVGAAPWVGALAQAPAATYPNKPVRIIVGFPAGTGPDIVARLLAQKLSEGWGNQAVIVDNKPGAGGLIAASEAARAAADGYTLMLGETGQLSIAPSSYNKLPYDPAKDFAPVSQVVTSDFILLANPKRCLPKTSRNLWTGHASRRACSWPLLVRVHRGILVPICLATRSASSPNRCTTKPRVTR